MVKRYKTYRFNVVYKDLFNHCYQYMFQLIAKCFMNRLKISVTAPQKSYYLHKVFPDFPSTLTI